MSISKFAAVALLASSAVAQTYTPYLNRDQPGGQSDYEHRSQVEAELAMANLNNNAHLQTSVSGQGLILPIDLAGGDTLCQMLPGANPLWEPIGAECRVISTQQDSVATGQIFSPACGVSGLACYNAANGGTGSCFNYEVRYICDIPASAGSDPHFQAFGGGKYDVMGEPGKVYNVITHPDLQVNARFVGGQTAHNTTYLGELGIQYKGHQVEFEPSSCTAEVLDMSVHLSRTFGPFHTENGLFLDMNGKGATITAGPYNLNLLCVNKRQSQHFNMKAGYYSPPGSEEERSHGLLGQTADMVSREGQALPGGKQGEGVIDGHYTDYEVSDLFSNDFRYNLYQH